MAHIQAQIEELKKQHDSRAAEMNQVMEQFGRLADNMGEYTRQKLENELVLKELQMLTDDSTVFKKVGGCLIKQDMFEATSNVEKRIEYISQELNRIEDQKTKTEEKRSKLGKAISRIEGDLQHIMKSMAAAQEASKD